MTDSTNLDVSLEKAKGLERRMTVRVPAAEIEREIDARLIKVGRTARIKGFRPGKIPPKVVRQHYGPQVRQEVLADVIRASFSRAVQQAELNPAGGPAIEPLGGADGKHFSYRATFEVYPEIALKGLEKLGIDKPVVAITAADVEKMIERLRRQRATWRSVDRKAQVNDRVTVDFTGKIDGTTFAGGEGKDVPVVLGSGQVVEDFDAALRDVEKGEEKTAKVKFPKNYGVASVAGNKAVFEIRVKGVEEQVLPEIDQEFLSAFGVTDGGLDALKVEVRKNMQRELDERHRLHMRAQALNALLDGNRIAVPNALVMQEMRSLQADAMRRLGTQDPVKAPPVESFRESATRRVQLGLLVQEVIRAHKVELDRHRVDRRIEELSAPYEKPHEAAQLYRSSRELMGQVESAVLEDQVVDFLLAHGKVKDKASTFDEFMGMEVSK
ncbi:MAG TPA: trigger factor [Gammaproteobacteria bacterium]